MALTGVKIKPGRCEKLFEEITSKVNKELLEIRKDLESKDFDQFEKSYPNEYQAISNLIDTASKSINQFKGFYVDIVGLFVTRFKAGETGKSGFLSRSVVVRTRWSQILHSFGQVSQEAYQVLESNKKFLEKTKKLKKESKKSGVDKGYEELEKDFKGITNDIKKQIDKLNDAVKQLNDEFMGFRMIFGQRFRWHYVSKRQERGSIGGLVMGLSQVTAEILNRMAKLRRVNAKYSRQDILGKNPDDIAKAVGVTGKGGYDDWLKGANFYNVFTNGIARLQDLFNLTEFITKSMVKKGKFGDITVKQSIFKTKRKRKIHKWLWHYIEQDIDMFSDRIRMVAEAFGHMNYGPPYNQLASELYMLRKSFEEKKQRLGAVYHLFVQALE